MNAQNEPILDPDLPIIDAHHHFWPTAPLPGSGILMVPDLAKNFHSGHKFLGSVYIECHSGYRTDGPAELRPVGETEFVVDQVTKFAPPAFQKGMCAGIVGFADLTLGERVRPVLEAHIAASHGRFRGIRHSTNFDDDPALAFLHMLGKSTHAKPDFRAGFAQLAPLGLAFDAMVFHPQLDEIAQLAKDFPGTTIVLNHLGGFIGVGRYRTHMADSIAAWKKSLRQISQCPNVYMKLGGLGMFLSGSPLLNRTPSATLDEVVADWKDAIEIGIELFGVDRCMMESNFPVDEAMCSYTRLWNAFKKITQGYSPTERRQLFGGVANAAYKLHLM